MTVPLLSTRQDRGAIAELMREAVPAVRNPSGEQVAVDADWLEVVADDPERLGLVHAALTALREAHEIWTFHDTNGAALVEHRPHLLWCRLDDRDETELVVAGTRRAEGTLRLWTWFRIEAPLEALNRYMRCGARAFPALRLRAGYVESRDVLYLQPDPPAAYRVVRVCPDLPVYGYLGRSGGYPSLVGLEIQDARRVASQVDGSAISALMTTRAEIDGSTAPLGEHVSRLLGAGDER